MWRMPVKKKNQSSSVKLSEELERILHNLYDSRMNKFDFWYTAVGDKIASAAEPVKLVNSVLIVRVKDSVWRFELTRRKTELIDKINNSVNKGRIIKDIVFK
jgi:predicted nucleic acid-binding Zn ribbon protein